MVWDKDNVFSRINVDQGRNTLWETLNKKEWHRIGRGDNVSS